jgi:glyoxylase I family protein
VADTNRTGIHHVDLVVSSIERSLAFYRSLLLPLGYVGSSEIEGERGERVVYLGGPGVVEIGLRAAQTSGTYNRYRVGVHHIAFRADGREVVDERHRWCLGEGIQIESPPREYGYMPGYYAFFFYDPDGIKLEIVHVPERS